MVGVGVGVVGVRVVSGSEVVAALHLELFELPLFRGSGSGNGEHDEGRESDGGERTHVEKYKRVAKKKKVLCESGSDVKGVKMQ